MVSPKGCCVCIAIFSLPGGVSMPVANCAGVVGFGNSLALCSLITSRNKALSRTLRLTTWPTLMPLQQSPSSFSMAVKPRLGFSPNKPQQAAGIRIDPPPSVACATGTMPAATAAAAPPLEPPVEIIRIPRITGCAVCNWLCGQCKAELWCIRFAQND